MQKKQLAWLSLMLMCVSALGGNVIEKVLSSLGRPEFNQQLVEHTTEVTQEVVNNAIITGTEIMLNSAREKTPEMVSNPDIYKYIFTVTKECAKEIGGYVKNHPKFSFACGLFFLTAMFYMKNKYNTFVLRNKNLKQKKILEEKQQDSVKKNILFFNNRKIEQEIQTKSLEQNIKKTAEAIEKERCIIQSFQEFATNLKNIDNNGNTNTFDTTVAQLMQLFGICSNAQEYINGTNEEKQAKQNVLLETLKNNDKEKRDDSYEEKVINNFIKKEVPVVKNSGKNKKIVKTTYSKALLNYVLGKKRTQNITKDKNGSTILKNIPHAYSKLVKNKALAQQKLKFF